MERRNPHLLRECSAIVLISEVTHYRAEPLGMIISKISGLCKVDSDWDFERSRLDDAVEWIVKDHARTAETVGRTVLFQHEKESNLRGFAESKENGLS